MTTTEQVEQIIIESLYRNPSVVQRLKIREVAGCVVTVIAEQSLATLSAADAKRLVQKNNMKRPGQPHILAAIDMCCAAVGVMPGVLSNRKCAPHAQAIVYMLREGIRFPVQPSLWEVSDAMLYLSHASVVGAMNRASKNGGLVAKMFDYLNAHGIATHPRPDWAKEAA